ncbi:MAG: hypothetical protein HC843_09525 [Sphingomonadales bacterium]|nr:hypothetical protein [Sphingomonadales bacterium]
MTIASLDDIAAGLVNGIRYPINKASLSSVVAGSEASLWRAATLPAAGAIPTAAAICSDALAGAVPLAPRTVGQDRIIAGFELMSDTASVDQCVEDRLAHMGGLSGTLTTAQNVGIDLNANLAVNNLAERIGSADYSEVEWYLEWYTATGATVSTPTVNVTYDDGTTGNCNVWVLGATALPATVAASRRYKIISATGKGIRAVNTVTLSASTGTAGNFGVTAVRKLFFCVALLANRWEKLDWSGTYAAKVADKACLTFSTLCITTTTRLRYGRLIQAVN